MAVTDMFAGEIATELLKQLFAIVRRSALCKASAEQLVHHINDLLPIIQEIKYSGVELPQFRQSQLDRLSEVLVSGFDLSTKVLASNRWNVYKNLQLARKMEKLERHVARFVQGPMQAHVLADVHRLRFDSAERFDRIEGSTRRLESQLGSLRIGGGGGGDSGGWLEDEMKRVGELEVMFEGSLGVGLEVGVKKVKEMVMGRDVGGGVLGICGIGGSGKTTLARELCKDDQFKSYFRDRILFLTVSQSPNIEELRLKVWRFLTETENMNVNTVVPNWNLQCPSKSTASALVVLDDVWSLSILEQLIFRVPGCTTIVVSRSKFPTVFNQTYEVELLNDNEAMTLFCHSAFGQNCVPVSADDQLVKLDADAKWGKRVDDHDAKRMMREAEVIRHVSLVKKLEWKLALAERKLMKAEQTLSKVEAFLKPADRQPDLEGITDEERFMFRKLGLRMKAFLLLGRRGVFDGTVENMHLHWKYRELVKIIVKANNFDDVKKIALSLEAESGGVLVSVDKVSKGYAIIVFRGREYHRPTTIRPKNLLTKRKALARSIELQRREALLKHIVQLRRNTDKLRSEIEHVDVKDEGNLELYDSLDAAYPTEDEDTEGEEETEVVPYYRSDEDEDGEDESDDYVHSYLEKIA